MSTRLLRAAVSNAEIGLHRVTAVVSDDPALEDVLVGAYSRFVLVGADGVRLHEEVLHAGGWAPETGRFRRWESLGAARRPAGPRAHDGHSPRSPHVQARLAARLAADPRRADRRDRLAHEHPPASRCERTLAQRKQAEQRRITANLDQFAAIPAQRSSTSGGGGGERAVQPRSRQQDARRARPVPPRPQVLGGTPRRLEGERDRELAAIDARYARPAAAPLPGRRDLRRAPSGRPSDDRRARSAAAGTAHRRCAAAPRLAQPGRGLRPVPVGPGAAQTWPTLDALEPGDRDRLRRAHSAWQADPAAGRRGVDRLRAGATCSAGATRCASTAWTSLSVERGRARRDRHPPSFALVEPGRGSAESSPTPSGCSAWSASPALHRQRGSPRSDWAATPVDRLAQLCRHHDVPLGLATDGRWWALVWAPRGGVTTTAVFDAVAWPEAAERDVVRAFVSLLCRRRFFAVPDAETAAVRCCAQAWTARRTSPRPSASRSARPSNCWSPRSAAPTSATARSGGAGIGDVSAHEVYRGAVAVMMRIVFLLFAEERRLLPSDNELYARRTRRPALRRAGAAGPGRHRGRAGAHAGRLAPAARAVPRRLLRRRSSAPDDARPRRLALRPGRVRLAAAHDRRPHRAAHAARRAVRRDRHRQEPGTPHAVLPAASTSSRSATSTKACCRSRASAPTESSSA